MNEFLPFPAPAKLNLFLHVTGRRSDGYHLLQSVFRLISMHDTLHLRVTDNGSIQRLNKIDGVAPEQDLCVRAARLLQQHAGCRAGVEIRLEKRLPMGGGLGGGSSDAATALLALNRLWGLDLPRSELLALALRLGADVPMFVFGRNAWAEGIGEELQPIILAPAWYVVLTPAVHVETAQVFASEELTRDTIPAKMAAFFRGYGHNDLQPAVCRQYPAVASALAWLKQFGDARMSGSGASVFLECDSEAQAQRIFALKPEQVSGFVAEGLDQHPLLNFAD
ncbi:4-diphosphocytidyl-2-C-methyl-D-erythritol kinase [mine drainage metagenome]|uniref:4-(cytidine 5'-diphospho)-2-C-methyl-D-erythritol kinase n=1 Tax=mine drainage metagenome TaxID=410659 RepID=A0A1J5QKT8_9ZZZZ